MLVFLVHVRDPQFYALPAKTRAKNGRIRVMGFPPIGIMSLSSVLTRAGHECVMFDQANPDTPNDVIIEQINRREPALVGLSFLSTTSYPYAKMLARQIRAANAKVKLAFGGVFASLNAALVKRQCPDVDFVCRGDGEQLLLDLLERLDDPSGVSGVTWAKDGQVIENPSRPLDRNLDQWPFPDRESLPLDFIEAMPLDVPAVLSLDRFTTMQTSRGCPWPCVFCDIPAFNEGKWRARSPGHVVEEIAHLQQLGYGSVYFVDDHFLLQPRRIEAICTGITDRNLTVKWGCEGRVDSVAQHLFPAMARAHCRTVMFGIESGSQRILDRLEKGQTLAEVETAVTGAKRAGIEIVHGFFTVGNPDETVPDMEATFDLAARLPLDTFAFNRLCVYRGTPLWQEYLSRGLVNEAEDWYKYFKCSAIDPTCLPGDVINDTRRTGIRRLIIHKFLHYPRQTLTLLRRFLRHMPVRDVVYLLIKPLVGKRSGATAAEVLSRTVEHGARKDEAANLTQVTDDRLERTLLEPGAEPLQDPARDETPTSVSPSPYMRKGTRNGAGVVRRSVEASEGWGGSLEGVVTAVSSQTLTVEADGRPSTFTLKPSTKVTRPGYGAGPEWPPTHVIRKDDTVLVLYRAEGTALLATEICMIPRSR